MLGTHHDYLHTDGANFMDEPAEAGGIVVYGPACSDPVFDHKNNKVMNPAGATDVAVAGILLNTVIDEDPSKCCKNHHIQGEVYKCSKVTILNACNGWVITNMVDPAAAASIKTGETAYLSSSPGPNGEGLFTNADDQGPAVGTFLSCVSGAYDTGQEESPCEEAECCKGFVKVRVSC